MNTIKTKYHFRHHTIDVEAINPKTLYSMRDAGDILGCGMSKMRTLLREGTLKYDVEFNYHNKFISGKELLRFLATGWKK